MPRAGREKWRLWSTADEERLGLVGKVVSPIGPPEGGRVERSADRKWLTVYGPAADGHREPAVEVYVLVPEFRS